VTGRSGSPDRGFGCTAGISHADRMADQPCEIRIVMLRRPPPRLYASLVLGCQSVAALLGMGSYATVHHDDTVTDDAINAMHDAMAVHDPWEG
jgi:hypothetical protein